jgi:WD40 repeat protein
MMRAPICTACPDASELRGLLDSNLTEDAQARLVAHLDCCESCAHSLEVMAGGGTEFSSAVEHIDRDTPAETSAFWPALRKLDVNAVLPQSPDATKTRSASAERDFPTFEDISLDFLDPPEQPNTLGKLGRFHVVGVVGSGGMGIVLRALDVCLQRQVALKVLDPRYAKNEVARSRFIREARAAAAITHENVVAVHHVEKHREELPYLVMRLVSGQSLQDLLDKRGALTAHEILRIGQQVASGLAAAHQAGLIHRDIKPANILLEADTDKVLLTDFGLARAVEDSKLTQSGFVPGTPLYMSPEQARGEMLDHRSDLFSLGSVLYAMATGNPPFQGSSPFVVLREVTETRQKPVHAVNPKIPEELAGLIDQLLEKDPKNRLQSAAEIADVMGAILARLPVDHESQTKLPRNNRRLVRYSTNWWTRNGSWVAVILLGFNGVLLASELAKWTQWTVIGQRGSSNEFGPPPRAILAGKTGTIWSVAITPDGETLAMALDDGSIKLWDLKTGQIQATIDRAHHGPIWCVRFSPDGSKFATASDDGTFQVWNTKTHKNIHRIPLATGIRAVAFSPDGTRLITGSRNGVIRFYDVEKGEELFNIPNAHGGPIMAVSFSPDGKHIASASGDKTVNIRDAKTGDLTYTFKEHSGSVYTLAYHPSGKMIASGSWDHTIRLWNPDTGDVIKVLSGHKEDVWSVAFNDDGSKLASVSEDRTMRLWDVASGEEIMNCKGPTGSIFTVAVRGKTIAIGGRDGNVRLWDMAE